DRVRDQPNFTLVGDAEVDRLLVEGDRVAGVVVREGSAETVIRADRVVVCGGAYGSPAVLLRSGIGPESHLREGGSEVRHELRGVGETLHDQPAFQVGYTGTPELRAQSTAFAKDRWLPYEQVIAKYPSEQCDEGFDMHIYPIGGPMPLPDMPFYLCGAVLRP